MKTHKPRRVTLFCGHYGSGKTNLAVNYALWQKAMGYPVVIADCDIVNPYFRTKDSAAELERAGITLISPQFANTNLDLPALPAALYGAVQDRTRQAVLDIGGDDRGAYALGRYAPYILEENDYHMIFVANFARPLTRTAEDALAVMAEIEAAAKIPFTAIVNNSNIGNLTTKEDVLATDARARELAEKSGLPLLFTSAVLPIAEALPPEIGRVFGITLQKKYFDIKGE